MNGLSTGNYQVVAQAHIGSQFANLLVGSKGSIEQTEAVKLLNPLAIQHVGFGSAGHVLYMACIDHSNLKAVLFQYFVETDPVNTRRFQRDGFNPTSALTKPLIHEGLA
jgi:hypothetical protein